MNVEKFVTHIKKSIVRDNLQTYRDIIENTQIEEISDPYWLNTISLYNSLNQSQKNNLIEIIEQVQIDTISNIFAIFDGAILLDDENSSFELKKGDSKLNGDLQDLFLESIE